MKLRTEEVKFKNGKTITITQENWSISMTLSEERRKAIEKPLEDKRLQYFREEIYPLLYSPASGNAPSLEAAYAMIGTAPDDLDEWYRAVQRLNPGWFQWLQHHDSEKVVFSIYQDLYIVDGNEPKEDLSFEEHTIYVIDGNVPSGFMKIRDLENSMSRSDEDTKAQIFRLVFYPKLAACSIGDVPSVEEARDAMPTQELNKWYEAVCRVNPHWFKPLQDLQAESEAETLKKKRKRPGRSGNGSKTY